VFGCALVAACERGPVETVCPAVNEGDLVITELRGPQGGGADTWGQWIELYNASGTDLTLSGLVLQLKKLDGSSKATLAVRSYELEVDDGDYVVLGRLPQGDDLPDHLDYGYEDDFASDLYMDGILQVYGCEELPVDQVVYYDLPAEGSLSFDGNLEPSAEANDEEDNWCVDDTEVQPGDGGTPQAGIPGTPGEGNRPCE